MAKKVSPEKKDAKTKAAVSSVTPDAGEPEPEHDDAEQDSEFFSLDEVKELLLFAARRGIEDTEKCVEALHDYVAEYEDAPDDAAKRVAEKKTFDEYVKLCSVTFPILGVNGRTLVDSKNHHEHTIKVLAVGAFFLVCALGTQILGLWFKGDPGSDPGDTSWFVDFHRYALTYLSPFFWGGLGASVYLVKRLSDELSSFRFDSRQFNGWFTRIMLGAVLGAAVVFIFDPDLFTDGEGKPLQLSTNVVAFLTGIGVKVVYGAIEQTIETLGDKLNLAAVRRSERVRAVAMGAVTGASGTGTGDTDQEDGKTGKQGKKNP